jgi:hypothetical protein
MTRQEQRYRRLNIEGFPRFEAKAFVNIKLSDPAMLMLRKERRAALRETRKQGISRTALNRQIAVFYRSEGHYRARRYLPLALFATYEAKQKALEAGRIRGLEARERRETKAVDRSYRRRYNILINSGFLRFEARILAAMAHIRPGNRNRAFNTKPWQAMMQTRMDLVARLKSKGYSNSEIRRMIRQWYRLGKISDPYEFLRREYKPKSKPLFYRVVQSIMPKRQMGRRRAAMIWD